VDRFLAHNPEYRAAAFSEAAALTGTTPQVIEKDFWVTWVLGKLFADSRLQSLLVFKGGTSLSKVYQLIQRFSEDIDLVLDWSVLNEVDPQAERSQTKQGRLNEELNLGAQAYLRTDLLPAIQFLLQGTCTVAIDAKDPHSLLVTYPSSFPDGYLRPEVKLEIGPLASKEPQELRQISSYAADALPQLFEVSACSVNVIRAERTFWEKVTILHQEAFREHGPLPSRYSRHYYDLYKLAASPMGKAAAQDLALLKDVVAFKKKFYPRAWARYELAVPGTLRLLPPGPFLGALEEDYRAMADMIFEKEVPAFAEVMASLRELELELNASPRGLSAP